MESYFGNPKLGSTYQKWKYRNRKCELTKSNSIVNKKSANQPTNFKKSEWNTGHQNIPEANIVSNTDTAAHSRASHSRIISTDASGSVSEASAQVMNLKMEPAKKTPLYVII